MDYCEKNSICTSPFRQITAYLFLIYLSLHNVSTFPVETFAFL